MIYRHGNNARQHESFLRAQRRHDNAAPDDDGYDEAFTNACERIGDMTGHGELIDAVASAESVLSWIASNVKIPWQYAQDFRTLLNQSELAMRAVQKNIELWRKGE